MNISEADAVSKVLSAITNDRHVDADELCDAMQFLDLRAARALQVGGVVPRDGIPVAASRLAQANADAL